jgi:hypothetical protein
MVSQNMLSIHTFLSGGVKNMFWVDLFLTQKKRAGNPGTSCSTKPGNKLGIAGIVKSFAIQPVN